MAADVMPPWSAIACSARNWRRLSLCSRCGVSKDALLAIRFLRLGMAANHAERRRLGTMGDILSLELVRERRLWGGWGGRFLRFPGFIGFGHGRRARSNGPKNTKDANCQPPQARNVEPPTVALPCQQDLHILLNLLLWTSDKPARATKSWVTRRDDLTDSSSRALFRPRTAMAREMGRVS